MFHKQNSLHWVLSNPPCPSLTLSTCLCPLSGLAAAPTRKHLPYSTHNIACHFQPIDPDLCPIYDQFPGHRLSLRVIAQLDSEVEKTL